MFLNSIEIGASSIVWGNTRARYILWAGYIYAWFVHGLIWVDPDRAYIMHARADESTEHNRLDYYWTFYAISVALNCALGWQPELNSYSTVAVKAFFAKGHSRCTWVHVPRYTYFGMQISEERPSIRAVDQFLRRVDRSIPTVYRTIHCVLFIARSIEESFSIGFNHGDM